MRRLLKSPIFRHEIAFSNEDLAVAPEPKDETNKLYQQKLNVSFMPTLLFRLK